MSAPSKIAVDGYAAAVDGTVAVGTISLPLWLASLEVWVQALVLIGGAILLAMRIIAAWRDLRDGRRQRAAAPRDDEDERQ
jgi:hypothetical protein